MLSAQKKLNWIDFQVAHVNSAVWNLFCKWRITLYLKTRSSLVDMKIYQWILTLYNMAQGKGMFLSFFLCLWNWDKKKNVCGTAPLTSDLHQRFDKGAWEISAPRLAENVSNFGVKAYTHSFLSRMRKHLNISPKDSIATYTYFQPYGSFLVINYI